MKRLEKNAPFSNLAGGMIRVSFEGQLFFSSVVVNCQLVLPDTALKGRRIGTLCKQIQTQAGAVGALGS